MKLRYEYALGNVPSAASHIRTTVFLDEQGFSFDRDDTDDIAMHIVGYNGDIPVSVCRVFKSSDGKYITGRLAVLKEYRGLGCGKGILEAAEKYVRSVGGDSLWLHSQYQAKDFYLRCGYAQVGEIELEQGCEHIWMNKYVKTQG